MKFFVTYCAMDSSLANPLWHACLILSYWPEEGQKIQVTNAWGFYAAPMANPNTIMAKIKKKFGLGFDFQGNHGLLKKEEIRYLDLGHGLRGVTFDISLEQYLQLNKLCRGIQAEQEQAIQEAKQRLAATCAAPSSATIYQEEKNRALSEQRPPRLYPFEFRVSVGMGGGVSLNNSYTCKTMAVSLLKNIGIEQERLDAITHHNTSMALPIFSGQMESFYLYSTGPRCRHVSERTGNITFFRSWQEQGTRLFWSLPPQMLVTNSARLKRLFQLPREYVEPVKKIIRQLQEIENIIVNADIEVVETRRQALVNHIASLYSAFSLVSGIRSIQEIETKIDQASVFLDHISNAIYGDLDGLSDMESLVSRLDEKDQQKICKILGLSMPAPALASMG